LSLALFSQTFRRLLGVNPLQYRKNHWQQTAANSVATGEKVRS
jgi:AraC-like DNA-binding protein